MKTIISIVETNVLQQPFLTKMLVDELVNLSSLSRKLKPLVDFELHKDVKIGSIVMALKRLTPILQSMKMIKSKKLSNISGDLNIRLNLSIYTFENSKTIILAQQTLLDELSEMKDMFYTVSRGIHETSVVISTKYDFVLESIFKTEVTRFKVKNLSSITIKFMDEIADTPGLYSLIFNKLAWSGINVQETFSTSFEISIFFKEKDTDKAFSLIKDLFIQKTNHHKALIEDYNNNLS